MKKEESLIVSIDKKEEDELIFPSLNGIQVLLPAEKPIPRFSDELGEYNIFFTKETIQKIKDRYDGDHEIWISKDLEGIPDGSLVIRGNYSLSMIVDMEDCLM